MSARACFAWLLVLTTIPSYASAQTRGVGLPPLDIVVNPTRVVMDPVPAGTTAETSIVIENRTLCPVRYRFDMHAAPISALPQVVCPRRGEQPQLTTMTCRLLVDQPRPATISGVLNIRHTYDDSCQPPQLDTHRAYLDEQVADATRMYYEEFHRIVDYSDIEQARAEAEQELRDEIEALEQERDDLRANGSEEEQEIEARAWELQSRFNAEDQQLRQVIQTIVLRGPDFSLADAYAEEKAAEFEEEMDEREAERTEACDRVDDLRWEYMRALQELEQGLYCDQCNRPASRIVREDNESFEDHLDRVRGDPIPAPQEVVDETHRRYNREIAEAEERCIQRRDAIRELEAEIRAARDEHERRVAEIQQRFDDRVAALELQRSEAEGEYLGQQAEFRVRLDAAYAAREERIDEIAEQLRGRRDHFATLQREETELRRERQQEHQDLVSELWDAKNERERERSDWINGVQAQRREWFGSSVTFEAVFE